jgi:hypothetical protein
MIPYLKNNLIFKIASADAISKFKNVQAQSLLQISRKDLNFNDSTKESVLLEFDRFSSVILRIEKFLSSNEDRMISSSLCQVIFDSVQEEFSTIETTIINNPNIFKNGIYDFVKLIHSYTLYHYKPVIEESLSYSTSRSFELFINKINNYLQHHMVCIHEFNNNLVLRSERPFLCITDFCINIHEYQPIENVLLKRAQFFILRGSPKHFILKNYTDNEIFNNLASTFAYHEISLQEEIINEECLEAA